MMIASSVSFLSAFKKSQLQRRRQVFGILAPKPHYCRFNFSHSRTKLNVDCHFNKNNEI